MKRVLALVALAGAALVPSLYARDADRGWQGWIEADTLFVAAEDTGRIASMAAVEGADVAAGDLLFALGAETGRADLAAAEAAVAEARARLARLEAAQQRPEEIAVLESAAAQAEAALALSTAEYDRARSLSDRKVVADSQLDRARMARDRDAAALASIRAEIVVARLSGRAEDVAAAREAVAKADAALASARTRLDRLSVHAPVAGRVEEVYWRPGEVVPAGKPVVAILPPGNVRILFFVGETEVAALRPGDRVGVACDRCPAGLTARVGFVASRTEFTPPVIYNQEERAKLLFRVEALPDDPAAFPVGLPVRVTAGEAGS
jgi:HlyD family secretion protein